MGKPRYDKDAAQDIARDLADIAGRLASLKGEANVWLRDPDYDTLGLRLENAHAAVEAAAVWRLEKEGEVGRCVNVVLQDGSSGRCAFASRFSSMQGVRWLERYLAMVAFGNRLSTTGHRYLHRCPSIDVRGPRSFPLLAAHFPLSCISIQSRYKVCGDFEYRTCAGHHFWASRTSALQNAGWG